jgi:hypothetical protein
MAAMEEMAVQRRTLTGPITYVPRYRRMPPQILNVPTAWNGIESILHDLICRFCPGGISALEIGVDYGYSIVALANFFPVVVGVDTFCGDVHAGERDKDMYERVRDILAPWTNIRLVKADYRDFFRENGARFDLVHIDIVHTYEDTFRCGAMALMFSRVVIFHDTQSFPEVMLAVSDLAEKYEKRFYEWPECNGLGILA